MNISVIQASIRDADEILALQKVAYQSEAELNNDFTIPPLQQTLSEIEAEFETKIFLKAVQAGKIIGSVRAFLNSGTCLIGRLVIHPEQPITFDYKPPLGDGMGYNGLELLLLSFSGCSATAIVYLLRKMGKTVSGLEVNAKGIRREQPPIKFEKIFIKYILKSKDTKDADIQKAIHLAEQSVCPVWQMIKNNVEVIPEFKIIA